MDQENLTTEEMINSVEGANVSDTAGVGDDPGGGNGAAQAAEPVNYTYKALGQEVTEPIETILQRASQGYDYAQKMDALKQRDEQIAAREQALADQENRWKPINDYAEQNPDWKEHWEQAYQQRENFGRDPDQTQEVNLPPQILQQLKELNDFRNQTMAEKQEMKKQQEDAQLNQTIEQVKKEYPDFDFSRADETGRTTEYKILEHAQKQGINSFRAAFRDLYHDDLLKRAQERGAETAADTIRSRKKDGLLNVTDKSTGKDDEYDYSNKSYDQITNEALMELEGT